MKRAAALLGLALFAAAGLRAQAAAAPSGAVPPAPEAPPAAAAGAQPAAAPAAAPAKPAPEPYRPEEFPAWVRQLRRAEIIAIGIFPFMALGVSLGYDLGRFGVSGFNAQYAPGPFRQPGAPIAGNEERLGLLAVSFGFSLLAAGLDYLLGREEQAAGDGEPAPDR